MKSRPSLQRRMVLGMLGYLVLISAMVLAHGLLVNERAEVLMWNLLLDAEMEQLSRRTNDTSRRPGEPGLLELFEQGPDASLPDSLSGLAPGLHDEVMVGGREKAVLVRDMDGRRLMLALDITEFERAERELGWSLLSSSLAVVLGLGLFVVGGMAQLLGPLRELARRIGMLRPDESRQRIELPDNASSELVVIVEALNTYLERHDRFVERERSFIDTASHELRTPISVIAGASELALEADMPSTARVQVQRIQRTARSVEQLVEMLLVLAKDPERLARNSDRIELDQLLLEIADDHRHLCGEKDLDVRVLPAGACEVVAPVGIVQAAVGNLLRNAIENSDSGQISISLTPGAVVEIDDPGHGMSPEQISAIYARQARGDGRGGGGIGLELITRLCSHLGWRLKIEPKPGGRGTRATLDLGGSVVPPRDGGVKPGKAVAPTLL